jgi:hypothetical protein
MLYDSCAYNLIIFTKNKQTKCSDAVLFNLLFLVVTKLNKVSTLPRYQIYHFRHAETGRFSRFVTVFN